MVYNRDWLVLFNKDTEQFRNYDRYDGFLNVELEEGSALRTLNGDLWLGSRQGILTFSPDKLETQHTNYDTRIVDFKVSNRDLRSLNDCPIQESITYTDALQLKYNQSMFTIEFAALNFYNQNRVSYRYILEGYEKEWHYNGKNRIASYTMYLPEIMCSGWKQWMKQILNSFLPVHWQSPFSRPGG